MTVNIPSSGIEIKLDRVDLKLERVIDEMRFLKSHTIALDSRLRGIEAYLKPSEQQPIANSRRGSRAAHAGGPRAQQAGKLETWALFAGSQGGTVARAGGNTCGPLSARLDLRPPRFPGLVGCFRTFRLRRGCRQPSAEP